MAAEEGMEGDEAVVAVDQAVEEEVMTGKEPCFVLYCSTCE